MKKRNFKALHGDVQIMERKIPSEAKVDSEKKDNCLAYGEVTGHAHRITAGKVDFMKLGSQTFLRVLEEAKLTHEEHNMITLPPGDYEYGITQEYDYDMEESRRVAD